MDFLFPKTTKINWLQKPGKTVTKPSHYFILITEELSHRITELQGSQFNNQRKEKRLSTLPWKDKTEIRLEWEKQTMIKEHQWLALVDLWSFPSPSSCTGQRLFLLLSDSCHYFIEKSQFPIQIFKR